MSLAKWLFTTLFRLFPLPGRTGLVVVGNPDSESPVLVTGNYELTITRVREALKGCSCYLLVAPTRGINVWCAATGGIFTANSVIVALKTSGIGKLVRHRRLILPQLSAAGIDCDEIRRRAGWSCVFGPVYAKDLPAYLAAGFQKSPAMHLTEFRLRDRLEQAVSPTILVSAVLVPLVMLVNAGSVVPALGALWALSLFHHAFVLRIPGQFAHQKGLVVGAGFGAVYVLFQAFRGQDGWMGDAGVAAGLVILSLLLSFEVPSVSPFWRCFRSRLKETSLNRQTVRIDDTVCGGCAVCASVCPKGCFEVPDGKALLLPARTCLKCKACILQCPTAALRFEGAGGH